MHSLGADSELLFGINPDPCSYFFTHQKSAKGIKKGGIFQTPYLVDRSRRSPSVEQTGSTISLDSVEVPDFSDACLKFISDILLEEDLDETPIPLQDYRALQATEKSLYDALGKEYSPSSDYLPPSSEQSFESSGFGFDLSYPKSSNCFDDSRDWVSTSPVSTLTPAATDEETILASSSRGEKNRQRDDYDPEEGRSNKHQASYNDDYVEMEQYDDVLLCKEDKVDISTCSEESCINEAGEKFKKKGYKGRTSRGKYKYKHNKVEEVDLRILLSRCAQAISNFDLRTANELLKQVRQHSSAYGDSLQRLAHHFANGLEARLAGTGSTVPTNVVDARISSSDFLKAYKLYVSAVPFKRMSYFVANNSILKIAEKATRIHIIDFGVLFGLQWPCLIQNLSRRLTGPPNLRITGIDYPQHGFRPAEMVEATGHRLSGYCERFNVPFRYQAIAKKWETIQPEDLNIESDELVIVNCMFRSGTLLDETVKENNSPRDAFLKLIKQINPHLFIHGTVNGTFNAPFFISRFRETLFQYSSVFDIFEATMPLEDHERFLIESEICGKEALNVIACEGAERIQRPETYKQWQVRTKRVGLRQLPLDQGLFRRAKAMVRANYHKDFMVDEDRHWMLQGWKGRILCAISFWQPN